MIVDEVLVVAMRSSDSSSEMATSQAGTFSFLLPPTWTRRSRCNLLLIERPA